MPLSMMEKKLASMPEKYQKLFFDEHLQYFMASNKEGTEYDFLFYNGKVSKTIVMKINDPDNRTTWEKIPTANYDIYHSYQEWAISRGLDYSKVNYKTWEKVRNSR